MLINPAHNAFASTPIKPELPHVLIIYTGGTIGMVQNPHTGAHEPIDFSHLLSHVPELQSVSVNFNTIQFNPPLDSANMNPTLWANMVHVIVDNYDKYDGFVVLGPVASGLRYRNRLVHPQEGRYATVVRHDQKRYQLDLGHHILVFCITRQRGSRHSLAPAVAYCWRRSIASYDEP